MAKILIPTPLRQFADKQDSVELRGSPWARLLTGADHANIPTCASTCTTTKASCAAS